MAGQRCQLPWTPEVPKVLPGSRILEVEGLVGAQAATVQRQACEGPAQVAHDGCLAAT